MRARSDQVKSGRVTWRRRTPAGGAAPGSQRLSGSRPSGEAWRTRRIDERAGRGRRAPQRGRFLGTIPPVKAVAAGVWTLEVEERRAGDVWSRSTGRGPIATPRPGTQQRDEAVGVVLDVEVVGPACERLDEGGCRVLSEQARRGQPQQSAPRRRLAHLQHGAVLQPEYLGRPLHRAHALPLRLPSAGSASGSTFLVAAFPARRRR